MAPTPKSSHVVHAGTLVRTPQSKQRLHYNTPKSAHPSPNLNSTAKEAEHPVEVIGRIRDYTDKKGNPSATPVLQVNNCQTLRVRTDIGYRDFVLDGVSMSEEEDLDAFYRKFVEGRIRGVKMGKKCTIMMYGPTGSGKSHTMFGCARQQGIVYRSLKEILGEDDGGGGGEGMFVQVSVLEIYNEEIYDLLPSNGGAGGLGYGFPKGGSASKVKLEVMGKKAKNATFLSGTEAGKISKEIQKVEKRRIVKSTHCNERSSRSHCMIILDVPKVGGRLMLVDMAGSENIEQAGQNGFEAKMQTAKINQGNIALKRVVESIANGDSHVPFRDSKLTMLLQDSFEDDKSKILMILCASPDPKEMYKTISTLEYGSKAKCIVCGPHTSNRDKSGVEDSSSVIIDSRLAAKDQFICKLQRENKLREKERNEAHKELMKKEEEIAALRLKLEALAEKGAGTSEEEINLKVNDRTRLLQTELEKKLEECRKMTNEFVEMERRRMEHTIIQQQQEVERLRHRLQEYESELLRARSKKSADRGAKDIDVNGFAKEFVSVNPDEDESMVMSMELDMGGDTEPLIREVKHIDGTIQQKDLKQEEDPYNPSHLCLLERGSIFSSRYDDRVCLSTVFEEDEVEEDEDAAQINMEQEAEEEIKKEIVEETRVSPFTYSPEKSNLIQNFDIITPEKESNSARLKRIQNIFTLCGNYRELSHHTTPSKTRPENDATHQTMVEYSSPASAKASAEAREFVTEKTPKQFSKSKRHSSDLKENINPNNEGTGDQTEIYVKWEASKVNPGKFITTLRVRKDASLAELRKLIEINLGADSKPFTFLVLGDPSGAPVPKQKEATMHADELPVCNSQLKGHLACLRPSKENSTQRSTDLPLSSIENKLPLTPIPFSLHKGNNFSPKLAHSGLGNFSSSNIVASSAAITCGTKGLI
ncbi:unnamed protein product [Rhodiola kirilowii]